MRWFDRFLNPKYVAGAQPPDPQSGPSAGVAPGFQLAHGGEIPVRLINEPGIGEAPQWAMNTTQYFLQSDWTGAHLPYTAGSYGSGVAIKFCRSPSIVQAGFIIDNVPTIVAPMPMMSQIPTPMPLTLY